MHARGLALPARCTSGEVAGSSTTALDTPGWRTRGWPCPCRSRRRRPPARRPAGVRRACGRPPRPDDRGGSARRSPRPSRTAGPEASRRSTCRVFLPTQKTSTRCASAEAVSAARHPRGVDVGTTLSLLIACCCWWAAPRAVVGVLFARARADATASGGGAPHVVAQIENRPPEPQYVRREPQPAPRPLRDMAQHGVSWQAQLKQQVESVHLSGEELRRETRALAEALAGPRCAVTGASCSCAGVWRSPASHLAMQLRGAGVSTVRRGIRPARCRRRP